MERKTNRQLLHCLPVSVPPGLLELLEEIALNDLETFLFCILNLLVWGSLMTMSLCNIILYFNGEWGPPFFFPHRATKSQSRPWRHSTSSSQGTFSPILPRQDELDLNRWFEEAS
jgi:hypothetical protein